MGSRGVARDDEHLHIAREQECSCYVGIVRDHGGGLGAVGHACGVAEVEDGLVRQQSDHLLHDGEAADAGVEDPDGTIVGHQRPKFQGTRTPMLTPPSVLRDVETSAGKSCRCAVTYASTAAMKVNTAVYTIQSWRCSSRELSRLRAFSSP